MRVSVSDGLPAEPRARTADLDAEGGRGLALVDVLSDRWGVREEAEESVTGKAVWFELAEPPLFS